MGGRAAERYRTALYASSYTFYSAQSVVAYGQPEATRYPCSRGTYMQDPFHVMRLQTPTIASPSLRTNRRSTFRVQHTTLLPRRRSVFASPLRATVCSHALRPSTPYSAQTRSETLSPHIQGAFFGSLSELDGRRDATRTAQTCGIDAQDIQPMIS